MSLTRRMIAVGLPAAGTVLAALALSGAPAAASPVGGGAQPVVMTTPCAGGYHSECPAHGYGNAAPATTAPSTATGTPTATSTATVHTRGHAAGHTRGHSGYGGTSPTTPPTTSPAVPTKSTGPTPTAHTDTVPPGGVSPTTATPAPSPSPSKPGGGVSAGSALPVTGAPMGAIASVGGLLVAAGAASVWYTRRRRNA